MSSYLTIGPNEISPNEIQQIFQPRTSKSSRLWDLAQTANSLAQTVEDHWDDLIDEGRDLLAAFAYEAIDPPAGILGRFRTLINRVYLAIIVFKGEQDAFIAYANACQHLINAILSAIEREDEAYQQTLSEALAEVLAESKTSKAMTAEEACEWIREISYQAFSEI
ncbi:MAG: hypothetical protein GDA56_22410 [Hormoscilla sp. GM7CHS1pb]|nr:hypothetical protein [Hormoscilla sp. GM7CHS1pb]